MNIRTFQSSDREHVQEFMALLQDHLSQMDFMDYLKSYEDFDSAAYFEKILKQAREKSGEVFIAESSEQIVGFVAGHIKGGDPLEEYPHTTGYISDIYVDEGHRNQGVGEQLLKAMETHLKAQGCDRIYLILFKPNERALPFYKRAGYEEYSMELMKRLD